METNEKAAAVTVQVTKDVAYVNSVARRPEIYDGISDDHSPGIAVVDVGPQMAAGLALQVFVGYEPAGAFLLQPKGHGVYEVHTMLLECCRGALAEAAGRAMLEFMFLTTNAQRICSVCPEWSPAAHVFARRLGGRDEFVRAAKYVKRGQPQSGTYVSITLAEWVRGAAADYVAAGVAFHHQLFTLLGEESHPPDDNHDGMVGLALAMAVHRRNPMKAELVYNEWAAMAGYQPITFLGERQGWLAVDIVSAVIAVDAAVNVRVIRKAELCQR